MTNTKLSDILAAAGDGNNFRNTWDNTQAAEEFAPLPAGVYVAHVIAGELFNARQNRTPGYKLTFKVCEGEHVGRQFWHDLWLTPAALPMAKRDLGKLGVTAMEQLEQPMPPGIRCKVKVALRKDDNGTEHNRVKSFEMIGIDRPEADAFAPVDVAQDNGDKAESQGDGADPDTMPEKPKDGIPI